MRHTNCNEPVNEKNFDDLKEDGVPIVDSGVVEKSQKPRPN